MSKYGLAKKTRKKILSQKANVFTRPEESERAKEIRRRTSGKKDYLADSMKKHNERMRRKWAAEKVKKR